MTIDKGLNKIRWFKFLAEKKWKIILCGTRTELAFDVN